MEYTCVRQIEKADCGVACLATIAKAYGLKTSMEQIREIAGTDVEGTSILGIVRAAERLGFNAKGFKVEEDIFNNQFDIPVPCIAHVRINDQFQHYVVIYEITENYIVVADPGKGIIKITREQLLGKEKLIDGTLYKWTGLVIVLRRTINLNSTNRKQRNN